MEKPEHILANPICLRERCYLPHEIMEKDTCRSDQETTGSITSTLCPGAFLIHGKSTLGCSLGSAGALGGVSPPEWFVYKKGLKSQVSLI